MIDACSIDEIIKRGNHKMYNLSKTCKKVVGIDINKDGIKILNQMGIEAYCYDIQSESLKEVVSNDHYYTFTPITLIKLMDSIGLELNKLYFDREIVPRFIPKNIFLKRIYLFLYKKVINKNSNLIYIGNSKMEAHKN